jgi:hypothetical protein
MSIDKLNVTISFKSVAKSADISAIVSVLDGVGNVIDCVNALIDNTTLKLKPSCIDDGTITQLMIETENNPIDTYVLAWNAALGKMEWVAGSETGDSYKVRFAADDTPDYLGNKISAAIVVDDDGNLNLAGEQTFTDVSVESITVGSETIALIETDGTLPDSDNTKIPTTAAVKSYVDFFAASLGKVKIADKSSANTLGLVDITKLVRMTGTYTQTLDSAATLADGFWCYLWNSGDGDITLAATGGDTIDGLTSFVMYPHEIRLLQCDGTQFISVVLNGFKKTFTSSGTFIKPSGYKAFKGFVWGAGGSGAKSSTADCAGGSGGGCSPFEFDESLFGSSETVTIGSGGARVATNAIAGSAGGDSSLGTLLVSGGGNGGVISSAFVLGGVAYKNISALTDDSPVYTSHNDLSPLGAYLSGGSSSKDAYRYWSIYGGGAGGGVKSTTGHAGGLSLYGGDGGAGSFYTSGGDGSLPAGGGGSTRNAASYSGAGANGQVIIEGVI